MQLQWRHRPGPLPDSSGQLKAALSLCHLQLRPRILARPGPGFICAACGSRWHEAALILCRMKHCWFMFWDHGKGGCVA